MSTLVEDRREYPLPSLEEILEGVREERRKIFEKYGVRTVDDLLVMVLKQRISLEELLIIRNRLDVLNKMEKIIVNELSKKSISKEIKFILNRFKIIGVRR